jgi:ketosteroid isomerase-like protein
VGEAVRNLAGRYCEAVLSGDPDAFAACWSDDAEWVAAGGRVFGGRARIVQVFEKARVPFELCVQELLSAVIEPVGEGSTTARARWQIRELQWRTDGSTTFVIGTYTDDCGLDADGVWRFRRRQFDEVRRGTF